MKKDWKVIIIDDEEDVHHAVRISLKRTKFLGRKFNFVSAFSAKEGREAIVNNPDAAIVLLDVVMEDESAGLKLIKIIREDLANKNVRIILRTGQPGKAPESEVIDQYEIDGYRVKGDAEETLITSIKTALRSFDTISKLDHYKRGLEIINNLEKLVNNLSIVPHFNNNRPPLYTPITLEILRDILCRDPWEKSLCSGFYGMLSAVLNEDRTYEMVINENAKLADEESMQGYHNQFFNVFSTIGEHSQRGKEFDFNEEELEALNMAKIRKDHFFTENFSVLFYENDEIEAVSEKGMHFIFLKNFPPFDRNLASMFMEKIYGVYLKAWRFI